MNLENKTPIKTSNFYEEHLKLSSVWTWQSDLHRSEDSLVPVPLTEDALAKADSLLIHAEFQTASGTQLTGLIVYQFGDDEVFAIEVLAADQKFTFNKHVSDLSLEELKRLASFLNENVEDLLPIKYSVVPKEIAIEEGKFSF